jgi:hypothetical protein
MSLTFRTIFITIFFTLCFICPTKAQPRVGEFINVSVGYGISAATDETSIDGSGFYAQGEYVFALTKWIGIRPYAGVIFTSATEKDSQPNQPEYKVTSNAFLFGGKVRVAAPIPWVAPYIELGIGAIIGSLETFTPKTNSKDNGLSMHIPFSIGLVLGPKHNFDVAFTYYIHPSADQFSGAAAIGFSFPLDAD